MIKVILKNIQYLADNNFISNMQQIKLKIYFKKCMNYISYEHLTKDNTLLEI